MTALVVYESIYGNTRQIAEAIAAELGSEASVRSVGEAESAPDVDLLIVGGPTHMHGLTTSMTRSMAAKAAEEDEDTPVEPGAAEGPGVRGWLKSLDGVSGANAAAFDTRGDANAALTGSAARGVARRLRRRGYDVVGMESFLVDNTEGPLADGELERARAWARGSGGGRRRRPVVPTVENAHLYGCPGPVRRLTSAEFLRCVAFEDRAAGSKSGSAGPPRAARERATLAVVERANEKRRPSMDAKKIVPVVVIAGGAAVLARKFGPRMCSSMSEMIQRMPDDAPPKWMFNNISALRDEHVRILEQQDRILDQLDELGREHGELLGAREGGNNGDD